MIDVAQAQQLVLDTACPLSGETIPATQAVGRVLAEDIFSDIDSPPYDKALMDGYALRGQEVVTGAVLSVIEEVAAGQMPRRTLGAGQAIRIMTGAPIPQGADAVVPLEDTQPLDGGQRVRIIRSGVERGDNILPRSSVIRHGEKVLLRGHVLRPLDIGLLAEVGRTRVSVIRRPKIAILATGDELVEPHEYPGPGQIRNSNGAMLTALVRSAGADAELLGIVADKRPLLHEAICKALASDVVLLTGGVSAGVHDYVPRVLEELGVKTVFHGVRVKPGKPVWYGHMTTSDGHRWVFGLPGNPVSSLVCFELFVRLLLDTLLGHGDRRSQRMGRAQMGEPFVHRGGRATYYPVLIRQAADTLLAVPLPWKGSADLRTLANAQALLVLPVEACQLHPGDSVDILWLSS